MAQVQERREALVATLTGKLLDGNGRVRGELTASTVRRLLKSLQQVRKEAGMEPLDVASIL